MLDLIKSTVFFILLGVVACTTADNSIKPQVMGLTESVYSSVTIQPDSLYDVFASVSGIVDQFMAEEGDKIKAGSPLVQIQNTMPKLNAENAQLALNQARRNSSKNSILLGAILDEIKTAKLKAANDSVNFERQKTLWNRQIGSRTDYEMKKLTAETSETQVKMLQDKYLRTKYDLNTALNQANNQYRSALSNSKDFTITSKLSGTVYSITKKQGEIVNPQTPLATIGSSNSFIIEMLIDEVDITKISKGQTILLTLDAYSKKVFEAQVGKIYPAKDIRTQTFKVEGVFTQKPEKLYPGLTGEANIVISTKKNVLTVPNEYINENSEVNTSDGLKYVKTGLSTLEYTEILSGIDSTTAITKPE